MSLIAMAVYDTETNNRTQYTIRSIQSVIKTVNLKKHKLFICDNNSCDATKDYYDALGLSPEYQSLNIEVILNSSNLGTARAINRAWLHRTEGEHCVKMDNDVEIREHGWLDILDECIERDPKIGIIGLKRKDLYEDPYLTMLNEGCDPLSKLNHNLGLASGLTVKNPPKHTDWPGWLRPLPHKRGDRWLNIEVVNHVMGTCQMYSSSLLDKIGYLYQMSRKDPTSGATLYNTYGFDDSLAAARCVKAGFYNCFYPHIEIDHIDPGETIYRTEKEKNAGEWMEPFLSLREQYLHGVKDIYHGPNDE